MPTVFESKINPPQGSNLIQSEHETLVSKDLTKIKDICGAYW